MRQKIVYHTPIIVKTVAKNGSERLGATAVCNTWTFMKGQRVEFQITMQGDTKADAIEKINNFLSGKGKHKVMEEFIEIKDNVVPEVFKNGDHVIYRAESSRRTIEKNCTFLGWSGQKFCFVQFNDKKNKSRIPIEKIRKYNG